MRAAVIDLGSNSVRLLAADLKDKSVIPVYRELKTTRLGRGVAQNRCLDETSMSDTLSAITYLINKAKSLSCEKILVFGTSALREAENSPDFLKRVKQIGLNVDILSEEEEAFYSFLGAKMGLGLSGATLVVDIGGGSTEFILGREQIEKSKSYPIGAVRWTQKYHTFNPLRYDEVIKSQQAANTLIADFANYYNQVAQKHFITVVGVGGTLTTLSAMIQELEVYNPEKVHGYCLKKADVEQIFSKLLSLTISEKRKLRGLSPERADIITAGVLITRVIMQKLDINKILVSESDIMEGYLLKSFVPKC